MSKSISFAQFGALKGKSTIQQPMVFYIRLSIQKLNLCNIATLTLKKHLTLFLTVSYLVSFDHFIS